MSSTPTDGAPELDEASAQAELAELVEGLSAHLRRRARLGQRRTLVAPNLEVQRSEVGAPAPSPAEAPRRAEPANPAPRPAARAPSPAPIRATGARPAPPPAPVGGADLAEKIAGNRAAAAACADLDALREAVARCTACELCQTRRQTVFSDGDGAAGVLFVGEAPGANEDEQGVPFVGAAGQLLTDIIHKGMKLDRQRTAIANVLKCRPPGNREPTDSEKALCTPWLDRQIELMAPRVVVALGRHAANHLLGYAGAARRSLGSLRGQVYERRGAKVVVTFHPSNLLREPDNKKECWKDIQIAMRELGLPAPPRSSGAN